MSNFILTRLVAVAVFGMLLPGCGSLMRSEYQRPPVQVPAGWQQGRAGNVQVSKTWWRVFDDPQLDLMMVRFNPIRIWPRLAWLSTKRAYRHNKLLPIAGPRRLPASMLSKASRWNKEEVARVSPVRFP